jgi:hypothetical protein
VFRGSVDDIMAELTRWDFLRFLSFAIFFNLFQ